MMKLRHLFDNRDLAIMLLRNWEYDESSLEMLNNFRISANAIYPFKKNEEIFFLRFAPRSEKTKEHINAELEFINYLNNRSYNALEIVPSRTGDQLVTKSTPWGDYYASAFMRVTGKPIDETNLNNELIHTFGKSLGKLHSLSSEYLNPQLKRWDYMDILNWIENSLQILPDAKQALLELKTLKKYFSSLPKTLNNYGLIHYDFETDNVFYDTDKNACSVIDFDDSVYHWYVMDIEQSLDSLKENFTEDEFIQKKAVFIRGYRSEFDVYDEELELFPVFRRFANLYGYTRILRSIQDKWNNEPEWLVSLRQKLTTAMNNCLRNFGEEIGLGITTQIINQ